MERIPCVSYFSAKLIASIQFVLTCWHFESLDEIDSSSQRNVFSEHFFALPHRQKVGQVLSARQVVDVDVVRRENLHFLLFTGFPFTIQFSGFFLKKKFWEFIFFKLGAVFSKLSTRALKNSTRECHYLWRLNLEALDNRLQCLKTWA